MYCDILKSKSDPQILYDPNEGKRSSRIEVLKRVQGVDIRVTLGRLIAMNALLAQSDQHLESIKEELHETIMREDIDAPTTRPY